MKNLYHLLLIIFVLFSSGLSAQILDEPYYERDTTSKYTIGLNTKFLDFKSVLQYSSPAGDPVSTIYQSRAQSVGVRVRYKGIALVIGTGVQAYPIDNRKLGSSLNIVLRFYPKNLYVKVDASYIADQGTLGQYISKFRETYRNDLFVWNLDNYALYAFKKDKINLQSFLGFRNKQLRTAGTWTANAYLKGSIVHASASVIDSLGWTEDLIPENLFFSRLGVGMGYLQSLKITEDLHFVAMVSLASEFAYSRSYDPVFNTTSEFDFLLNLKPHAFSSLNYNHNNFYSGLQFEYFPALGATRIENKYDFEYYSIRLSAGYRW